MIVTSYIQNQVVLHFVDIEEVDKGPDLTVLASY